MRLPLRSFASLVLAVGVATCSDAPHAPTTPSARSAHLALSPVFSPSAAAVYAKRATFAGVGFDHVRIVIIRPPSEVLKDTTIAFSPTSEPIPLDLTISVKTIGEFLDAEMSYLNNGVVVYQGRVRVQSYAADDPVPQSEPLVLSYVGPGSRAARVAVSPKTVSIVAPGGANFTAAVFDSSNTQLTDVPIAWSVSDPTVATIDGSGALIATGKRGTVTVTATTPTNLSDNATVTVSLPPTALNVVSGSGQTGRAGTTLPQPAVVEVTAADGGGVAGVTVNFVAPTGAAVGTPTAVTDDQGRASTTLTLAGTLGPQSFAVAAAGFTASITATAIAGDAAAIAVVSGSGQKDTVRKPLAAPFVVRVTDAFGNPVRGVTVNWARTAGTGTLAGTTSTTDDDGLASMTYTLGTTPGEETVTASVAGVSTGATFTATALPPGPSSITIVSGDDQTGRIGEPLTLSVKVTDDQGNGLAGQTVTWSATNGSIPATTPTDAEGISSNVLTLGTTVGPATVTASVGSGASAKSVSFTATVQAGIVAKLAFLVQPTNGSPLTPLMPAVQVELQDAGGNRTSAANPVTIALGANPGNATLGGTLTVTSVNGVATFEDLTIDQVGIGYTLVASSGGLQSVTSNPFEISGQPGVHLELATEYPTAATSGLPIIGGFTIYVRDANGDAVTTPSRQVTATFSNGSAQNNVVTTNSDGVAYFPDLILTGDADGTITFSSPGLAPVSAPMSVHPGSLIFVTSQGVPITNPPPITLTAGEAPTNLPLLQVRDFEGNGVSGVTAAYTVTRSSTTIASGNVTSGQGGLISFDALGLTQQAMQVAGNYAFTVTVAGLTGSPRTLNVTSQPGAPARYAVTAATTTPAPGAQDLITAQLADQYGNAVPTPTSRTVVWSAFDGSFSSPTSQTNAQGVATVTFTVPNTPNTTVNVTATDQANQNILGSVELIIGSSMQAAGLRVEAAPSVIVNGVVWDPQPVVQLVNSSGQPVALGGVPVTLYIEDPDMGDARVRGRSRGSTAAAQQRQREGTLVNGMAVTDQNGAAHFAGVRFIGELQNILMVFEAEVPQVGFVYGYYSDVVMQPGPAANIAALSTGPENVGVGTELPITITLVDQSGNVTTSPDAAVTFTPTAGSGSVSPTNTTTVNGVASTTWTMPSSPTVATLGVSAIIGSEPRSIVITKNVVLSSPNEMVSASPEVVVTPVGTQIDAGSYPRVLVLSSSEEGIQGIPVTFSANGTCFLSGQTQFTTDASGHAGLAAATLTFDVTEGGSCMVMATVNGLAPRLFRLIAAPSGEKTWTGAASTNWNDAANWFPSGAPAPSDAVFLPTYAATMATLSGPVTLAGVNAEFGASNIVNLGSSTLTITGSVNAGLGAILATNGGSVILNAPVGASPTVTGTISAPVTFGASSTSCPNAYTLTAGVTTESAVVNCTVQLLAPADGNALLNVNGSLTVQPAGRLAMNQSTAFVSVSADATFAAGSQVAISAGTLSVSGILTIETASFVHAPNANLYLNGPESVIIGSSVQQPLELGTVFVSGNRTLPANRSFALNSLIVSGGLTIPESTNVTVASNANFSTLSTTDVFGTLALNGPVIFSPQTIVTGTGTLTVSDPQTCTKYTGANGATVSVGSFTASPAQCANQVP